MTAAHHDLCGRCFQNVGDLHSAKPSFPLPCGHILCISCIYPDEDNCSICYQPLHIGFLTYIRDTANRLRYRLYRTSSHRPNHSNNPTGDPYLTRRSDYSSYDLVTRLNSAIAQINTDSSVSTLLGIKREADTFLRWQPRNQFKELEAKINLITCLINQLDIISSQESTIKSLLRTINVQTAHSQHAENTEHIREHDLASPLQEYFASKTKEEIHVKKPLQQRDRKPAAEDEYSPQTTNDVNVDSVSTTRNGHRTTPPRHNNNQRTVTALSFPKYEEGDDYFSLPTREERQGNNRYPGSDGLVKAPPPRQAPLPLSDIDETGSVLQSRMRDSTPSIRHASPRQYPQLPKRRDQQIQTPDFEGGFDPTSRPALHISIPKGPTFYSLSTGEHYIRSDIRTTPVQSNGTRHCGEYSSRATGEGDRGDRFSPLPEEDEWDEGAVNHQQYAGRMKKRVKPKGKARAWSPSMYYGTPDVSSGEYNMHGGKNGQSVNRPNLSRFSSLSSIGLLKTPDPRGGIMPTMQLLGGKVYDSPLPFPLHPVPKHPRQSYDPVLTTFDSDYALDTPEPQRVPLHGPSMLGQPSPNDDQYYHYQSIAVGSIENSPAREVPIDVNVHVNVKDNRPGRGTLGNRSDRIISTTTIGGDIPSAYSSPGPTDLPSYYRPERRVRSSLSKQNMNGNGNGNGNGNQRDRYGYDGYMSSAESSASGWVSSATAVQNSPRRRLPVADDREEEDREGGDRGDGGREDDGREEEGREEEGREEEGREEEEEVERRNPARSLSYHVHFDEAMSGEERRGYEREEERAGEREREREMGCGRGRGRERDRERECDGECERECARGRSEDVGVREAQAERGIQVGLIPIPPEPCTPPDRYKKIKPNEVGSTSTSISNHPVSSSSSSLDKIKTTTTTTKGLGMGMGMGVGMAAASPQTPHSAVSSSSSANASASTSATSTMSTSANPNPTNPSGHLNPTANAHPNQNQNPNSNSNTNTNTNAMNINSSRQSDVRSSTSPRVVDEEQSPQISLVAVVAKDQEMDKGRRKGGGGGIGIGGGIGVGVGGGGGGVGGGVRGAEMSPIEREKKKSNSTMTMTMAFKGQPQHQTSSRATVFSRP